MNSIDDVYIRYHQSINMSCSALKNWDKNPVSRKASLDQGPIKRNIKLACKPKAEWTNKDIKDAKRTISFIARMRRVKPGKAVKGTDLSKRDISLLNWGFDPRGG